MVIIQTASRQKNATITAAVAASLAEDVGAGDITAALIAEDVQVTDDGVYRPLFKSRFGFHLFVGQILDECIYVFTFVEKILSLLHHG